MPAKRMIQEKKYLKKEMTAVLRMRIWTKQSLVQRYAILFPEIILFTDLRYLCFERSIV